MPTRDNPVINKHHCGAYFYFEDGEHQIIVHSGKWGEEVVLVNGSEVVSITNNWKTHSVHTFELDNNRYEVEFNVLSLIKGKLKVSLIKNDTHLKSYVISIFDDKKATKKFIILSLLSGLVSGYVTFHLLDALIG